ncbi:MAG: trypsin-like peptidase domain-containing protein [Candidatus Eisenbacteria bacterium]
MSRSIIVACFVILVVLIAGAAHGERKVAEEALVFREVRDGVFTIFGDRGHGSGFLIDGGLVLTNSHVVSGSRYITVQLDESTRVRAVLLAEDKSKDVAVLGIAPNVLAGRPALDIPDRDADSLAFEGEKVIAIGSPLNQTRILTSGIVSKIEPRAILSDVNINPGNSGGPLINMDSEVIAINTFRDPSLGGSGISGSILITEATAIIEKAKQKMSDAEIPGGELLPVTPEEAYPIECLPWASKRSHDAKNYSVPRAGKFDVTISTPPREHFIGTAASERLAGKRRERETAAGVEDSDMYDPLGDRMKEWEEFVGQHAPIVYIRVTPSIGETGGSAFLNILGAGLAGATGTYYSGYHVYEFKSDLQDFELKSRGEPVSELFRSMDMMPVSVAVYGGHMDDIAQQGVFAYLPGPFAIGDSDSLVIFLQDLKKPGDTVEVVLPLKCLEQVWVDFEPYRDMFVARTRPLLVD